MVDHFTKTIWLYATKDQRAETTAPVVADFFLKYGIPDKFLSDQGKNYQIVLLAQLLELLDVHQIRTTIFRSQTDGISEKGIRSTIKMIKCFVLDSQDDWDEFLANWRSHTIKQLDMLRQDSHRYT